MQEAFDYLIDFIFIIDIVFSFFTAYFDKRGDKIQDLLMIRKKYFQEWFLIDFVAAFPFEAIAIMSNLNLNVSILNLFKIPRLLRLGRLTKKLDQLAGANCEAPVRFRPLHPLDCLRLVLHWKIPGRG